MSGREGESREPGLGGVRWGKRGATLAGSMWPRREGVRRASMGSCAEAALGEERSAAARIGNRWRGTVGAID